MHFRIRRVGCKIAAMKVLLMTTLLLPSLTLFAQEKSQMETVYPGWAKAQRYAAAGFHPIDCFAGQVRVRGNRLARQSFAVFRPNAEMKCCGERVKSGTTDKHGHFAVEPLSEGPYFALFSSNGVVYTTNFAVINSYQSCGSEYVVLNFSATDQCVLQTYIAVDYSEEDCSETDPACYRK